MKNHIVVIDDGVNSCKELEQSIEGLLEFDFDSNKISNQKTKIKENSHGTICALIIKKYFPGARIISIKILNEKLHASSVALLSALEWCENNEVDIINLSLGTTNVLDFTKLYESIERLQKLGKRVIAAINNDFTYTLPASHIHSIGVCAKEFNVDGKLRGLLGIDFEGISQHELTINGRKFTTSICNSYAAPYITGLVGKSATTNHSIENSALCKNFSESNNVAIILENGSWLINEESHERIEQLSIAESENVCIYLDCSYQSKCFLEEYFCKENILVVNIVNEKTGKKFRRKLASILENPIFVVCNQSIKKSADYRLIEKGEGKFVVTSKKLGFVVKKKCTDMASCCDYLKERIYH